MSRIAFRVDAGARIGLGHAMRCLTLANALREKTGEHSTFMSRQMPDDMRARILSASHHHITIGQTDSPQPGPQQGQYGLWLGTTVEQDCQDTLSALESAGNDWDWVFVDHYGLSDIWEARLVHEIGVRIFAIDDLDRTHHCHALLDQTLGKTNQAYTDRVPDAAHLMVGANFALLRPEFADARDRVLARRDEGFAKSSPVKTLLVAMGGMDADNATTDVLNAFKRYGDRDTHVSVMLGKMAPHLASVTNFLQSLPNTTELISGTDRVAELLGRMDVCIGAPGSSSWERCCLGLPTVLVTIADNQREIAANLTAASAAICGGSISDPDRTSLDRAIEKMFGSSATRARISRNARVVCDGRGTRRAVAHMLEATA